MKPENIALGDSNDEYLKLAISSIINLQRRALETTTSVLEHVTSILRILFCSIYKSVLDGQLIHDYTSLTLITLLCLLIMVVIRLRWESQSLAKTSKECTSNNSNVAQPYSWSVFDLAKTAYEPGHTEAVMNVVDKLFYDVNSALPSNGLTLFLCACLSGKRDMIDYMIAKGADIHRTTKAGDTALYLATFGILSSPFPDVRVLENLIKAGCDINRANKNGYTPLHRAAGHGNLRVIKLLLKHGADPYQVSATGTYPIDSATNAGNLEAAALLKIHIPNPHVWDVIEPHTPPSIKLGLLSPQRKHLIESARRITSPNVN